MKRYVACDFGALGTIVLVVEEAMPDGTLLLVPDRTGCLECRRRGGRCDRHAVAALRCIPGGEATDGL